MFRVFLELSLDCFIEQSKFLTTDELDPVRKAAAGQTLLVAAIRTMNGYVHSRHYSPVGSELRVAWDDLQLFIEQLWLNI